MAKKKNKKTNHIKFTTLAIFKCTVTCVQHIHITVQQSSQSFFILQIWNSVPIVNNSFKTYPQSLVTNLLLSVSYDFDCTLDAAYSGSV